MRTPAGSRSCSPRLPSSPPGLLKLPELFGTAGAGIGGQILLGSLLAGVGAYLSVRFLVRYLRTRTLTPFGIYCIVAGLGCLAYLTLIK